LISGNCQPLSADAGSRVEFRPMREYVPFQRFRAQFKLRPAFTFA
jgi:hypothetical protein